LSEKEAWVADRKQLFIGGKWVEGTGTGSIPVHSPATGELLAEVPMGTAEDVDQAVEAARAARHQIASMGPYQRGGLLHAIADVISERKEEIARDLAQEQGKPFHSEALGEVEAAVEMWRDAAEVIKRLEGEVVPSSDPQKRIFTIRQPRGVYGVITPWNFPATIPTEYLCAGLACGNAIVWKPSELTPLTALHLARAIDDAGAPPGAVNVVTGDGPTVGEAIVSHPGVDAVGATGSPQTGDRIARLAGAKPVLLELGGNCPAIVFADADVDMAIGRMISGCFANAGQICDSTERIIVHESLHDRVVEGLVKGAEAIKLGASLDPDTTMGPLNNEHTAAKIDRHLADAATSGATVLAGGARADDRPTHLYYRPTVVDGVTPEMEIFREETFGPVASVITFAEIDEAIGLANDNDLGLVAGVFTSDPQLAAFAGERLEAGIVNLNDVPTYWQPHTAFGGFSGKRSGVGRLGGKYTIMEMSQIKTLVYDARLGGPR
jgi:succinate-semialdehyde dehydrogenase/glutarate-semialdehyde dehydrogenase